MAVQIGSARVDERGKYSGGKAGDQTGNEVSRQNWYLHKKGWIIIRAKDPSSRKKIAIAMRSACANNKIGYSQSDRYGLYREVKNKGFDPAKCSKNVNTDCSALIRVCCCYAGIIVGDFNTGSEISILSKTGKFDIIRDKKYTKVQDYLLEGDILVTETKGHTVAALSNGVKATTSNAKPALANYTIKKGNKGSQVKTLQQDLNYVLGTKLVVDGDCGTATVNAILEFQKKFGIKQTGIYDKDTYNKMKAVL